MLAKMVQFIGLVLLFFTCLYYQASAAPLTKPVAVSPSSDFTCDVCKVFSSGLELILEQDTPEEDIVKVLAQACILLQIEDENVCNLVVEEFKEEVLTVAYEISLGRAKQACSILIGPSCQAAYDPWSQFWNVTIPGDKPTVTPIPDPKGDAPVSRILHLSDIHWDQNYTAGLSNDCGEPICCRPPNKPGSGSSAAGFWGDYKCDLPYSTLISLMQYLVTIKDEFDWVYVTGDLPAHNVWNQSRSDQLFILNTISSLMHQYLPAKKVYFTLGNHESAPVNSFPPPFITGNKSNQWLLDGAAKAWGEWLSPDAIETLKIGGYYNQKIQDGLRVISLQTNFGNSQNYWLLINDTDPAGQLAWLAEQLLEAEKAGDKVHIIGHIPPGQFTHSFGWNYHDIVNRFEDTIVGQFFGHTHKDEFEVFFDDTNTTRATSIAFIGPSITPDNVNAGFRIYTVDGNYTGSSHAVLDFIAYFLNISDANLNNKTKWMKEYSAKADFVMPRLHPADWADLVQRFKTDDTLFQRYYKYKYKLHPPSPVCNAACKSSILCDLVTSRPDDPSACTTLVLQGEGVGQVTMGDIIKERNKNKGKC